MENILRIEELNDNDYSGFNIITDKQTITVGISNGQNCCENWGYFMSNDNFNDFVGAELFEVKLVDDCLNVKKLEENGGYEPCVMFVNFETSKGTIQFTAYNSHNGYYGHEAMVKSEQLRHTDVL